MGPFLLPVPNVQETSEGQGGLGEGEARGGQGRAGEGSPRTPAVQDPFSTLRALGTSGSCAQRPVCPGKPRQPRGSGAGRKQWKAEPGTPEDVQNKRRNYFAAAAELAGIRTL